MMAVVARADNLTQALDTLNSQFGMGVFKMRWISKTTMQELDSVQAVLQLHHEPFIFVQAGPSLTFNILQLKCLPSNMLKAASPYANRVYYRLGTARWRFIRMVTQNVTLA
jgi:hypothetical protein